jgi:peptidoglycan/xylan/chitin deacetylase (PgdA/CDA1 family)
MLHKLRQTASKLKFYLGYNPKILPQQKSFIPENFKSVLLISADFELAWAVCHSRRYKGNAEMQTRAVTSERENIPEIIKVCEKFNVPITWATVGHLFLNHCSRHNSKAHPEIPDVPSYTGPFWDFEGGDWFAPDPSTNLETNPEWYAPDLIQKIIQSDVPHEIACHTFSHIDCRDGICPPELMTAELNECKRLAAEKNITLKSFVHPGHTIGNIEVLQQQGFTNFRTDYRNVLGYPKRHTSGIWELEQTAELVYNKKWTTDYHIFRYKKIIERAIKSGTVCVMWFHPSCHPKLVSEIFPKIFEYAHSKKDDLWITTHEKYIDWLNENIKK